MPTRDINKLLDERKDSSVNITNKETGNNGQSNQRRVKKKVYLISDRMVVKHIKAWNLSNKFDQNYNLCLEFPRSKGQKHERLFKTLYLRRKPGPHNTPRRNKQT